MSTKAKIGGGLLLVLLLLQVIPVGSRENPPVIKEPAWDSPKTRELAVKACFDCHSNETVWPWYSYVAPISWLVIHDVDEGREHLNLSEFDRPQTHAHEAAEQVEEGEMPLPIYRPLHPEASLTPEETKLLIEGLGKTLGTERDKGER